MAKLVRPALLALLVAGCLAATAAPAAAQGLDWGECPPNDDLDPEQQCATLTVPLDYSDPDGATIEIAVSRIPAQNPAQRRGILISNPGGPGESGIYDPSVLNDDYPQGILHRYDLIGFDPRGINFSAPLTCDLAPEDLDVLRLLPYPEPDGDISENVAYSQRVASGCAASQTASLLPHITTANTARDIDRIRAALGEQKVNYLGYSYGTYLGAVYAELFPQRTDRFVLDSVVHPRRIWRETFYAWGPAAEFALPPFLRFAAENSDTYGLGETSEEVRAKFFELLAEVEQEPFEHPALGVVDHRQFREYVRIALRNDDSFPELALIWMLVDQRELGPARTARAAEAAAQLRDESTPSFPDVARQAVTRAEFPVPFDDSAFVSLWAVACGDADWPESPATYQRDVLNADRLFPIIGPMAANIWPCAFWPFDPRDPVVDIGRLESGRALLVESFRDPATPYDGALALRATLGSRSRLVSVGDGGHSIVFNGRNTCADKATGSFLVTGRLPERDVVCPAEP
jgi:pimeloyl-ACP methyl ester carboxylesterase